MEQINHKVLKELDEKFGAPFYIMDPEKYRSNINGFLNAFKKRYEKRKGKEREEKKEEKV